jgi:nascent polypeptide-associated complex subunit beta
MADFVIDPAARAKMIEKRFGGQDSSRTGGKGSIRRKKKTVHKTTTSDDKKLGTTLKKLGVTNIPAIEEVNLFKDNGEVIHFVNPKVQASIAANTYVISGDCQTKKLQELLPGIINQLGPDNLANLKHIAEAYANSAGAKSAAAAPGGDDEDDDVPDLVENFEEVSTKN